MLLKIELYELVRQVVPWNPALHLHEKELMASRQDPPLAQGELEHSLMSLEKRKNIITENTLQVIHVLFTKKKSGAYLEMV